MALETRKTSVSSVKRFPEVVREDLNKFLQRSSWQRLTREFSVDVFTGVGPAALDNIADLVDENYPEFKNDVKKRLDILKNTVRGQIQSFKGKSKVGLHSYFYRFWLFGQHNADGLYDIVFCHICRKEEFDYFLFLNKVMKGGAYTLAAAKEFATDVIALIPRHVIPFLAMGNFQEPEEEVERALPAKPDDGSPYTTDLTKDLGDRLTEYELVEDLIERRTLGENEDGTLFLRLQ